MKRHAIYLTVFGLMQTAFAADYGSYVGELGKLGGRDCNKHDAACPIYPKIYRQRTNG